MTPNSLVNQFNFGMSFLDAYIRLCNKTRLTDINILSETFMCKLLSILNQCEYENANEIDGSTAGFDLFCDEKKVLMQVTSVCSSTKILSTFAKLEKHLADQSTLEKRIQDLEGKLKEKKYLTFEEREDLNTCKKKINSKKDIRNYRIKFLFLTSDASNLRKNQRVASAELPSSLLFDLDKDILDFASLSNIVLRRISFSEKAKELEDFMQNNPDIFVQKDVCRPNVQRIIEDYAKNYLSPLFLHKYEDSNVTLQNLYIHPSFSTISSMERRKNIQEPTEEQRDMVSLLCDFLWQKRTNDKERILFIEGDAAIGKTSLISWLCYHYTQIDTEQDTKERAIGRAIFMNRKIVCVRLRELDFSSPTQNAITAVLKYLEIENLESFERQYAEAILLFDGADELSMVSGIASSSIENFILELRKAFSKHKLIVTTRPKFLNMEVFNRATFQIRHIVLNHFNREMRREWMDHYKSCGESISVSTEQYILSLSDQMASGVADTPLALYLLVRCDMREELLGNNWALFHEIFSNAIIEAEYNENFRTTSNDLRHRRAQTNYHVVSRIAYQMFKNAKEERYYVTETEIRQAIANTDLNGMSPEMIRQTCALCAYWKNASTLGALEFYHNNIRDFFLCEYICGELNTCFRDSSKDTLVSNLIELCCRMFSWGSISGTTWEQAFTFLYLRLKYESEYSHKGESLFDALVEKPFIEHFLYALVTGRKLWQFEYQDDSYPCSKYVFINAMMLNRILSNFVLKKNSRVELWHTDEEKLRWTQLGILWDWREIFSNSVAVSASMKIGIGSNTILNGINFSKCTLNKPNFAKAELDNSKFCSTDMANAVFSDAKLSLTDFSEANLSGANFSGAYIEDASLSRADLRHSNFSGVHMTNTDCVSAKVEGVDFSNSLIINNKWKLAQFGNNSFANAEIESVNIGGKKAPNLVFEQTTVKTLTVHNVTLVDIRIGGSSSFIQCDFSGSTFTKTREDAGYIHNSMFLACDFSRCNFTKMLHLSDIHMERCTFKNTNMYGLIFENCTFLNCNFQDASLINAKFIGCKVSGDDTRMAGADLRDADGTKSNFEGVNFFGVNKRGSKGFEKNNIVNPNYG